MTLEELKEHIAAVVAYNWPSEFRDALENGTEGHIINHLIALAEFIGDPPTSEEREELRKADEDLPFIELPERLRDAQAYMDALGDPAERSHCAGMIETWRNGGDWPSFSAQTLPMRQLARILRGEARYDGRGGLVDA